jgi:hypothetical protein
MVRGFTPDNAAVVGDLQTRSSRCGRRRRARARRSGGMAGRRGRSPFRCLRFGSTNLNRKQVLKKQLRARNSCAVGAARHRQTTRARARHFLAPQHLIVRRSCKTFHDRSRPNSLEVSQCGYTSKPSATITVALSTCCGWDGLDLRGLPLMECKRLLSQVVTPQPTPNRAFPCCLRAGHGRRSGETGGRSVHAG